MTGSQVDDFGSRLARELSQLDWQARNDLIIRIGRAEQKMRSLGQDRPVWRGPLPENDLLGKDVVVPTEQGERRGRVVCFGIANAGDLWERSVIVHVPASGTQHEACGSEVRLASAEDSERIQQEVEMARRLTEAADAATRGPTDPAAALRRAKRRGFRDPTLTSTLLTMAHDHTDVVDIEDCAANHKVVGRGKNKRVYIFKSQLRVDISGFTVTHPGIRTITEDEAKEMHLGKVRGQLLFEDREGALDAFKTVLAAIG